MAEVGSKRGADAATSTPPQQQSAKRQRSETNEHRASNKPFKRVDPTQIALCDANEDNSWAALRAKGHTYADKAQERLGPVKGKAFQKEMTKAKRGTYRGGIMDIGAVNSIKFADDAFD